ncbi:MAG: preprotein translocase subunit SecG [Ignavibacteriales bacterium]|nr:MAG: preprotein translocase subunit SecG [Ignavibacteriaceae bacterium]MBW7874087.1 preprotein translocase subunit SecG [Ignavibacteria bacterium]MCZ2143187.1 preprotein translocase subunit SecG [Ignavibacteriales bacterium]OQY71726.1 MAG: preprotein translocase subunit SecG [Ignavibacteriales bacterium UTCHB3]MBV6444067.1 hypothetical protein [Ignavibacteriaceae bacterium]
MYTFASILLILLGVLIIIVILTQQSKGSGLTATFGGGNVGSMFGTRRTADFLAKATWIMAATIAVLTILVNAFFLPGGQGGESANQKGPSNQSAPPAQTAPAQTPSAPAGGGQPAK